MELKQAIAVSNSAVYKSMYKAGFISSKFYTYVSIAVWVLAKTSETCTSKNKAVKLAELHFGVNKRTVWRALKTFEGI